MKLNEQSNMAIRVNNLHFSYGEGEIIRGLDTSIKRGQITTLIGANGCGKSTLLNLLTKNLKPSLGQILIEGCSVSEIPSKEFAKQVAIVHQKNTVPSDLTVRKLVEYGRVPHMRFGISPDSDKDKKMIDWALDITNTTQLSNMPVSALSGGQMQRVWIAMALAQDTKILMLDEPTTYLDIRYQLEILHLVRSLNENLGMTIVMVLHDINQALTYSDQVVAMKDGVVLKSGRPQDIITQELIKQVFDVELKIANIDNKPYVLAV